MPKKIRIGKVVSNAMTGTVAVEVERMKKHPLYHKAYRVTKKFLADTGSEKYEIGDMVSIEETRPLSKTKSWKVVAKV